MEKKVLKLTIFIFILNISCSKENVILGPQGDYPNDIGIKWVYTQHDGSKNSYKTITITITGETLIENKKLVKKILYKTNGLIDTNYLYCSNDTVKILESKYFNTSLYGYIFPLTVGNSWTHFNNSMRADSTFVLRELDIEVFPNEFYRGYELYSKGWIFEGGYYSRSLYVPGIGLIEKSITGLGSEETLKLASINFTPPNKLGK